jgi:hypothetical protein
MQAHVKNELKERKKEIVPLLGSHVISANKHHRA